MLPRSITKRWAVHESTQRGLVRLAFLLLIALPCAAILAAILIGNTPWYRSYRTKAIAAQLSSQLGMQVQIGSYYEPTPTSLLLRDVIVFNPETDREVMRARVAEANWNSKLVSFRISEPELQGDQLASTWRLLHDWFLCRPQLSNHPMSVAMNDLTIHNSSHTPTMVDVVCSITPSPESVQASITYRHASEPKGNEVNIQVVRHHREAVPMTEVDLNTGNSKVQCAILADRFPWLKRLGEVATFSGSLRWTFDDQGQWELRIQDRASHFKNIQWSSLGSQLPHPMTGQFDLSLHSLWLQDGRILRALGDLQSGERGGYLAKDSMIESRYQNTLQTRAFEGRLEKKNPTVWYTDLGVRFELSEHGVQLRGLLKPPEGDNYPRALIATKDETLLFEPEASRIPIDNFVQWLGGVSHPVASHLPIASQAQSNRVVRTQ